MTKGEFLDKLPDKIIKDGKIIQVKSEISKKLGMDKKGHDFKYFDNFVFNEGTGNDSNRSIDISLKV